VLPGRGLAEAALLLGADYSGGWCTMACAVTTASSRPSLVIAIRPSPAFRLALRDPVGGPIAGLGEAVAVPQGLQQPGNSGR